MKYDNTSMIDVVLTHGGRQLQGSFIARWLSTKPLVGEPEAGSRFSVGFSGVRPQLMARLNDNLRTRCLGLHYQVRGPQNFSEVKGHVRRVANFPGLAGALKSLRYQLKIYFENVGDETSQQPSRSHT